MGGRQMSRLLRLARFCGWYDRFGQKRSGPAAQCAGPSRVRRRDRCTTWPDRLVRGAVSARGGTRAGGRSNRSGRLAAYPCPGAAASAASLRRWIRTRSRVQSALRSAVDRGRRRPDSGTVDRSGTATSHERDPRACTRSSLCFRRDRTGVPGAGPHRGGPPADGGRGAGGVRAAGGRRPQVRLAIPCLRSGACLLTHFLWLKVAFSTMLFQYC